MKNRQELIAKHGTLLEFAEATWRAVPTEISVNEARAAILDYATELVCAKPTPEQFAEMGVVQANWEAYTRGDMVSPDARLIARLAYFAGVAMTTTQIGFAVSGDIEALPDGVQELVKRLIDECDADCEIYERITNPQPTTPRVS